MTFSCLRWKIQLLPFAQAHLNEVCSRDGVHCKTYSVSHSAILNLLAGADTCVRKLGPKMAERELNRMKCGTGRDSLIGI